MVVPGHGWHTAGHSSSKPHGFGASAPSTSQWSSRGSAAVSARSDWAGRSGTSSGVGGGSSFVSPTKNVMGMVTDATRGAASSRTPVEARFDAYKSMTHSATRRY